jgi:hypothetical protein
MEIEGSGNAIQLQLSLSLSPPFTVNAENNDNIINNTTIDRSTYNEKKMNDIDFDPKLRSSRILSAPFQPTTASTTSANSIIVVDESNNNSVPTQLQSNRVQADEVSYQNFQFPPLEKIKQLKFEKVLPIYLPIYQPILSTY